MKKYFFILIVFLCIPQFSDAAWYDNAWQYRVEINSNNVLVVDNELNIPLYLDLSLLPSNFFSNVKPDGSDIIITADDEMTALDYELVSLDTNNETGELYFKAHSLDASSDTSFYLYYGNSGTNPFVSGNIWGDYRGVWHFDEDLSAPEVQNLGVVTMAAMDGSDGGWSVWYGNNPIGSNVNVAVDEDQITDSERSHTNEQLGYWVFENGLTHIVDNMGSVIGESGVINTIGGSISSVSLDNSYTNPVVVASSQYTSGVPAVVRLDNLTSGGFDVFLQNPTPSSQSGIPDDTSVYYIVIEAGSHILPGGIPLEAGSATVTGVNSSSNWGSASMIQINPTSSFVNPVVLGSVLTNNNGQWQTFWSSNGSQTGPANGSNIYIGRHTGADNSPSVVDETLGYIIVEQHNGSNNGFQSLAQLGTDTVAGIDNSPAYAYPGLSGSGGIIGFSDSTINLFNTTIVGGVTTDSNAQIGRGVNLNGSGTRLPISGLNYTNSNNLDTLTASMWINTTDTARSGIFDFDRSEHWEIGLNFHNAGGDAGKISFDTASSSGGIKDLNSSTTVNDGNWHYITVVFDESDAQDKKIYIDGQLDTAVDQHIGSLGTGVTRYGIFGDGSEDGSGNGSANNIPYEGFIDEARIEHRAVSAGWVETNYNNQSNNASFWNIGTPEQQNLAPEPAENLFFNHSNAQGGNTNPINVEVGGINSYTPYLSAIYKGDGDTAVRAYIQVSTDSSFTTVDYWDSGWFDLTTTVTDNARSEDIEYDTSLSGASAALLPLVMDDANITYYWRIAFEDNSGLQGNFSSPAIFSLLDIPVAPGNVNGTKIEGAPDTFTINWQDTSVSETLFEVEFREDTGAGFSSWQLVTLPVVSPTPANTTSWDMHNTIDNAAYEFRVRSCNYAGCSSWVQDPMTHYTDPEAPINVCSEYISDTQFDVYWENRSVFDESTVEQCDGVDCSAPSFTTITSGQPEPGPVNGATTINNLYRWSVFADNGVVSSQPTYSHIEYTTPAEPTGVQASRVSDAIINLSWIDNSLYEDGFRVLVSIDGGSFNEITPGVNTVAANETMYTYTSASAGSEYQFQVHAHISETSCDSFVNNELLSNPGVSNVVVTTPNAPIISTVVHNNDNDIDVYWLDQSSFEDGFNVYVREDNGVWGLAGSVGADITTFNYTSGLANHIYDFYIEAFVNANPPTNPIGLTNTLGPAEFRRVYTRPTTPVLSDILISSTSVDWSVIDTADYELGFALYDSGTLDFIQSIGSPNITGFTETGLIPNTSYSRMVRSYVENSGVRLESVDSNIVTVFTLANSPSNPIATEVSQGEIEINWENGGNPTGTEFYIENTSTGENSSWISDMLTFTETELSCETTYEYILKARNGNLIETGEEIIQIETEECDEDSDTRGSRKVSQKILDMIFGNSDELIEETAEDNNEATYPLQANCFINYYRLIKRGMIGEDVRDVQRCMNSLGYTSGPEDGIYGPLTYAGITSYQRDKQLFYIDGIVGPETSGSLNALGEVTVNGM